MSVEMEALRRLPVAEKLRIVEQLWDDISAGEEAIPLPAWRQTEAQRRAAELEAHPEIALTREQLWERVNKGDE